MKNLKAKTDKRPGSTVPSRIYDIESKKQNASAKSIAEKVLKKIAPELKIDADLSQLKFDEVKETILGKHVLFQQQEEGKPISGAWVRVDLDNDGKVYNIQNDLIPHPALKKASKAKDKKSREVIDQMGVEEAKKIALAAAMVKGKVAGKVTETELTWYTVKDVPVLSWKIIVTAEKPVAQWKFYIDALTREILKKINLLKCADAVGKIFDPNPVIKLNGVKLTINSKIPDEAYLEVTLKGLRKTGFLDGAFVSTKKTAKRVKRTNLNFKFKREQRAFKEVMVYYHIDKVQRYIQELGFSNLLNKPIAVDVDGAVDEHGKPEDNSYYLPDSKSLLFGKGEVHDAEDAEIIIHEYGHAIQDAQVPGFGPEGEASAMGEGFGDYLAASFFANIKPANFRPTVGTWDCYFSGTGKPKCLRRLDSTKKYPKDMTGEVHDDGEIWSSCLWQIRTALGGKQTDKLVIAHHYLVTPKAKFADAAKALIMTDKRLNKGANEEMIHKVFADRGILPKIKKRIPKK